MKAYAVVGAVGAVAVLALGVWKVAGSVHPGSDAPKPGKGDVVIKADELGPAWPLTVAEVTIQCGPGDAVFGRYGDFTFALNDKARREAAALGKSLGPVEDIRKDDLERNFYIPDARMPLDPLMAVVSQRCSASGQKRA